MECEHNPTCSGHDDVAVRLNDISVCTTATTSTELRAIERDS